MPGLAAAAGAAGGGAAFLFFSLLGEWSVGFGHGVKGGYQGEHGLPSKGDASGPVVSEVADRLAVRSGSLVSDSAPQRAP